MLSIIKVATCKLVNRYGINTNKRLNSSFSWTLTRTRTSPPQPITTAISSLYHHHYQRSFVEVLRKTMSSTTTPPISEDANNNDDSRKRPSSSVDGTDNNDSTNIAVAATETSSSTPSSSSQPQQKQQGDNNNNNNKESSSSKRPWKKGKKDNSKSKNGRGGIKDYGDGARDKREDPPQLGSYANPAMREMYGVTLDFEPTTTATTNDDGDDKNTTETKDTVKRKVALLLGFLGTKYGGFQINPEQKTIQAEIELALYRSGMISKDNFGTQHKYSWSNSARTDKGKNRAVAVVVVLVVIILRTRVY
jgi:DNA mismatch repair ATPase MutL